MSYSPNSVNYNVQAPIRVISSSLEVGWNSLLVRTLDTPANLDPYDSLTTSDHSVVVCTEGEAEVGSYANGFWKKGFYRAGIGGMTPGGKTDRLRFKSKTSKRLVFIQICLPEIFLKSAAEELFTAKSPLDEHQPLNALCFYDPLINQIALSLNEAIRDGAANLYADTAAHFLAFHLLSKTYKRFEIAPDTRNPGITSDKRLHRASEFMIHHYAENLTIDELARESGISQFHFIRLFKKQYGITPYQYLINLRLNAAATHLKNTDLSIKEVAVRCGFVNTGRFPVIFQKHFGLSPTKYRHR